jgi:hypothetical protein
MVTWINLEVQTLNVVFKCKVLYSLSSDGLASVWITILVFIVSSVVVPLSRAMGTA